MAETAPQPQGNDTIDEPLEEQLAGEEQLAFEEELPPFEPFVPDTVEDLSYQIPVEDSVTPTAMSALVVAKTGDPNMDMLSIMNTDEVQQASDRETRIEMALLDQSTDPAKKLKAAQEIMNEPSEKRTLGEIVVKAAFTDLPEDQKEATASGIEIATRSRENKEIQKNILEGDPDETFEEYMKRWNPGIQEIAQEYKRNAIAAGSDIIDEWDEVRNPGDFLEYLNLKDAPDSLDVDVGIMLDSLLAGEGLGPQFTEAMVSSYGPEWKARATLFAIKEIGVDAALLITAWMNPVSGPLLFARKAEALGKVVNLGMKMKMALGRATLVGLGGGTIQSGLNIATGDDPDFIREVSLRFFTELGGEAFIKGISFAGKGVKKVLFDTRKSVAHNTKYKVQGKDDQTILTNSDSTHTSSLARVYVEASMLRLSKEFMRIGKMIADGVVSKDALDPIRRRAAQLMNVDEADIDLGVALAPAQFAKFTKLLKPKIKDGKVVVDSEGVIQQEFKTRGEVLGKAEVEKIQKAAKVVTDANEKEIVSLKKRIKSTKRALDKVSKPKDRDVLKEELGIMKKNIGRLESSIESRGKIVADLDITETTGAQMIDKILIGQGMGFRMIGNLTNVMQQNNTTFLTRMTEKAYAFKDYPRTPLKDVSDMMGYKLNGYSFLSDPEKFIGQAATDFLAALNRAESTTVVYNKMLKNAMRNISKKQRNEVWRVLQEGNDDSAVYNITDVIAKGLHTEVEQEAYYAVRSILDHAHFMFDRTMVRELESKVFEDGTRKVMRFKDKIVNVSKERSQKLTRALKEDGYVEVTQVPTNNQKPFSAVVKASELDKDLISVVDYEVGYVPRIYKDAKFFVGKVNLKTGAYSRVGAFTNRASQEKFMKELNDELKLASTEDIKEGVEVAFPGEWDEVFQRGSVGFDTQTIDAIDAAPAHAKQMFKDSLKEMGLGEKQVQFKLDAMDGADLRRPFAGERNVPLAGDAKHMETQHAIADYLQAISVKNGINDWRRHTVNWFHDKYADVIEDGMRWHDADPLVNYRGLIEERNKKLHVEAREVHLWMKRTILQTTSLEAKTEGLLKVVADKLNTNPNAGMRWVGRRLDNMPRMRQMNNIMRGIPATAKLLFMNLGQVVVQGSQMAATVGSRPVHAAGGMIDMMDASAGALAEFYGKEVTSPKVLQDLLAIRRSGWLANLDTTDLFNVTKPNRFGVIGKGFTLASKGPFRMGEGMNRALAFYTTRREFIDLLKKGGELPDGKFLGKIDDDEFLKQVVEKAKITALDMGKAGQLKAFSGYGSVLFQFQQVAPKMLNMFTSERLTATQKFGAASAMLALWGPTAIPFLPDLFNLSNFFAQQGLGLMRTDDQGVQFLTGARPSDAEKVTQAMDQAVTEASDIAAGFIGEMATSDFMKFLSDDTIKLLGDKQGVSDFIRRSAQKGFVFSATEGEIDLVNRVAVGRMATDAMRNSNWWDAVIMLSVVGDMVDAVKFTAKQGVLSPMNWITYVDLLGHAGGDELSYQGAFTNAFGAPPTKTGILILKELGQAISYAGHVSKFLETTTRDYWDDNFNIGTDPNNVTTSGGMDTGVAATPSRRIQMGLGLTPGLVKSQFEAKQLERRLQKQWSDWRNDMLDEFKRATNSRERIEIFGIVMREAAKMDELYSRNNVKGNIPEDFYGSTIESFIQNLIKHKSGEGSLVDPRL